MPIAYKEDEEQGEYNLPRKETVTRLALARRLQAIALALAADKPIRVGRASVRVPERVKFEQEFETEDGEMELELEITWEVGGADESRGRKGQKRGVKKERGKA